MYEDIGKKIKGLAKAAFVIEAIAAVIYGIVLLCEDEDLLFIAFLVWIAGFLVSWVSSWFLYGFGELIDQVCYIAENTQPRDRISEILPWTQNKPQVQPTAHTQSPTSKDAKSNSTNGKDASNPPVSAEIINGEKVCPKCGQSQRADRRVCWSCGQQFDN